MLRSYRKAIRRGAPGFSLIDLLAILLVLGVLCVLLYPVFAPSRGCRGPTCRSNCKQLVTAVQMYLQDYDGRYPGAWSGAAGDNQVGGWTSYTHFPNGRPGQFKPDLGTLHAYVKNIAVYECPQDPTHQGTSYALNSLLTSGGAAWHRGIADESVRDPAATILLAEEVTATRSTDDGYFVPGSSAVTTRHLAAPTYAFVDGHVRSLPGVTYPNAKGAQRFEP